MISHEEWHDVQFWIILSKSSESRAAWHFHQEFQQRRPMRRFHWQLFRGHLYLLQQLGKHWLREILDQSWPLSEEVILVAGSLNEAHLVCEILLTSYSIYSRIECGTLEISFSSWILGGLADKIMAHTDASSILSTSETCNRLDQFLRLVKRDTCARNPLIFSSHGVRSSYTRRSTRSAWLRQITKPKFVDRPGQKY